MTEGHPPSAKLLVKMELNRLMAPCTKALIYVARFKESVGNTILMAGKTGLMMWRSTLTKSLKKFGAYTEGCGKRSITREIISES